jgi:hypothetical protein
MEKGQQRQVFECNGTCVFQRNIKVFFYRKNKIKSKTMSKFERLSKTMCKFERLLYPKYLTNKCYLRMRFHSTVN